MKLITALLKAYKFADDQQKVFVFPVLSNSPRWLDTVKGDETGLTFQLTSTSSLPTQPMKGYTTPPGFTSPTLYEQQCGLRPERIRTVKELWDGAYGFPFLSKKTRMSNHL